MYGLRAISSLVVFSLLLTTAYSEVRLTQQSPPGLPCSEEEVVLQCTLQGTAAIWTFPGGEITLAPGSNEEITGNFHARPVGVANGEFTSTLTFPAENGTVVICSNGDRSMDDTRSVTVQGAPSVPTLSCVDVSGDFSGAVNVTVSWTLSGGDSVDFYLISITTNAPQTPYGGLLNITTASVTQYKLSGFMVGYEYNITVRGINCGSQEGRESEPQTIRLQVPDAPTNCATTVIYSQSSGVLLSVDNTWFTVPDPEDPCPDVTGDITQYQIRFQSGSLSTTEIVNIARCIARRCSHTFVPPSNPPSSYDSVSVAAVNVVGVGTARTCTTQTISVVNNLLTVQVIGVSSPVDTQLQCTFLPFFTGSARCRVQYGTDPTYMNLPYSAESTDTGTAGDSVSVVLRERLNSSTVYYYTVSAVSEDVTVVLRGNFTTPQYSCSLTELWNLPAAGVTLLPDVSLLNTSAARYRSCDAGSVGSAVLVNTTLNTATVAYYTGTTAGSTGCFVCDESSEYVPNTTTAAERVCRSNGTWSGSPILCGAVEPLPPDATMWIAVSTTAVVLFITGLLVGVLAGVSLYHCVIKHQALSSKLESSSHQEKKTVSSSNPLQQTGPQYEEVMELRQNRAYEPTQTSIKMRRNEAYGPTQH